MANTTMTVAELQRKANESPSRRRIVWEGPMPGPSTVLIVTEEGELYRIPDSDVPDDINLVYVGRCE